MQEALDVICLKIDSIMMLGAKLMKAILDYLMSFVFAYYDNANDNFLTMLLLDDCCYLLIMFGASIGVWSISG
jgi:hypothetical protein